MFACSNLVAVVLKARDSEADFCFFGIGNFVYISDLFLDSNVTFHYQLGPELGIIILFVCGGSKYYRCGSDSYPNFSLKTLLHILRKHENRHEIFTFRDVILFCLS